jgi:hypothetical protein
MDLIEALKIISNYCNNDVCTKDSCIMWELCIISFSEAPCEWNIFIDKMKDDDRN